VIKPVKIVVLELEPMSQGIRKTGVAVMEVGGTETKKRKNKEGRKTAECCTYGPGPLNVVD